MKTLLKSTALALAASSVAVTAIPAEAKGHGHAYGQRYQQTSRYNAYGNGYDNRYYGDQVYQNTRVWQGRDGSYYCQKKDGTTGLVIGAAAGALLGRAVDTRGDRALGTVLGAAAGALLGKQVAQGTRCR